jgi:hypothetical protein
MAHIFVSYKKEDKSRVAPIVAGLRAEGLNLWWDDDIGPGQPWDETIKAQLDDARCIVAIWSSLSVTAPWVKEEAGHGKARGILVPARIHDVEPPLGFGLIQAADLRFWKGDRTDPNWRAFVDHVRKVLRGEKIAQLTGTLSAGRGRAAGLAMFLGVAGVALTALGLAVFRPSSGPVAPKPVTAAEQAAWGDAVSAKARKPYEAYLATYPAGRFADDARAALAVCRTTTDASFEPFERKFNVHGGTTAAAFGDREGAITSARDSGRAQAERQCAGLATDEKVEDVRTRIEPANQPMCTQMGPKATTCTVSLWATCTGKKRIETPREICG